MDNNDRIGGRSMANKKAPKKTFSSSCFDAAMKLRGTSIRKLGAIEGGVGWSDKTIRRARKRGEISAELLDALAKRLDVAPDYLTGKYARDFSKLFPEPLDAESTAILEGMLAPERFPYLMSQHRTDLYDRYIDGILMIHDISFRQYSEMPADSKRQFELDIERAVCPVIRKYFRHDARGREGLPDLYRIEVEIDNYNPDEPEPDDKFFQKTPAGNRFEKEYQGE